MFWSDDRCVVRRTTKMADFCSIQRKHLWMYGFTNQRKLVATWKRAVCFGLPDRACGHRRVKLRIDRLSGQQHNDVVMPAGSEVKKNELCSSGQLAARSVAELFFLTIKEKQSFIQLRNFACSFCSVVAGFEMAAWRRYTLQLFWFQNVL